MRTKWTYEMLKKEALKYDTRNEFKKGSYGAYQDANKKDILNDICSHMIGNTKWTNYMIIKEALKYNNRNEFKKGSNAYKSAKRRGILDEVCSHMIRQGNLYNRFIYIIEFENNSVYIGLTCNLERRKYEHIKKSSNKYIKEFMNNNIKYTFNSNYILYSADKAHEIECALIEKYNNTNYNVLNISKGGELGSCNKWTEEIIREEALKYKTKADFIKNNRNVYQSAQSSGMLDKICSHMSGNINWLNDDMIENESLKYNSRNEFKIGNNKAYEAARRKGILDEVCSHMITKHIIWTEEMIREEALKYNTRTEFKNNSGGYKAAKRRGILDDVCSHMKKRSINF